MIISSINRFCHKHGRIAFAFILVVMALPFVFMDYFRSSGRQAPQMPDSIGSYFGEEIDYKDFSVRYAKAYRQMLGSGPVAQEKRMVKGLVDQMALLHEAKANDFGNVTKDDIKAKLAEQEYFSTDGKFDFAKYSKFPEGMRVVFEEQTADQIVIERLQNRTQELAASKVTEAQVRDAYNEENVTYSISAATFKGSDFTKAVKVEDAEIKKYYEENKEQYRVPEKKVMSVVKFSGKEFEAQAKTTEEELKAYYDKNAAQYHKDEVKASHILVKVEKDATEAVKAEKKKAIEDVLAKLKAGEKFEDLAKANSECPSKDKGGDLGWFGKGKMVKAFEEKAFAMKKGEVSEIVESEFGYHIIKLTDTPKPFEKLKAEITRKVKDELLTKLSGEAAHKFATAAYDYLEKKGKFEQFVKESGRTAFTTEPFEAGSYKQVKGIQSRKFASDVKGLDADNPLSEAIAGDGSNYYVAYFVKTVPSEILPYEKATDAKTKITNKLKTDKAEELAKARAEKALKDTKAAIEGGKKFADIAKAMKFVEIKDFKSKEWPQGLAAVSQVKKDLAGKKATDLFGPVKGWGGYDVVYIRAITPASDEDFAKDKESFEKQIKDKKKREAWSAKRKEIIEKANITLIAPWGEEKKEK